MVTNSEQTNYAVKINGVITGTPFSDKMAAELAKMQILAEANTNNTNILAEVVPVTADGKEVLLG